MGGINHILNCYTHETSTATANNVRQSLRATIATCDNRYVRQSLRATIVLLLCLLATLTAYAQQTPLECQGDSCDSNWLQSGPISFPIDLPNFPGCPLYLFVDFRPCGENVTEFKIERILWRVPDSTGDTSNPCYDFHQAYLNSIDKDEFIRNLYNVALEGYVRKTFDRKFMMDSLMLVVYPLDSGANARQTPRICPSQQTIFRTTHATCMISATRDYLPDAARTEEDGGKTSELNHEIPPPPPWTAFRRKSVRYLRCAGNIVICCRREYSLCRDTTSHATQVRLTSTSTGQYTCPNTPPDPQSYALYQYEVLGTRCLEYCLEGEIRSNTHTGDTPDLSRQAR